MAFSIALPDELLLKIFGLIDNRRTLLNILSTSRLFRRLGELLLYKSVTLSAFWAHMPHLLARMSQLHNTVTARRDLSASIKTLTLMVEGRKGLRHPSHFPNFARHLVRNIICELAGLRRLSVHFDPIALDLPNSRSLFPPFALTHLRWNNPVRQEDVELFSEFLESQASLEYLDIKWTSIDSLSLSHAALPRLGTLVADSKAAFNILQDRYLLHLDIRADDSDVHDNDSLRASLQQLKSLHCSTRFLQRVMSFTAGFSNLEYLALAFSRSSNSSPHSMTIEPSKLLLSLSSTNLQYIHISASIPPFDPQALFVAFPTLRAVDLPVPYKPEEYIRFAPQSSSYHDSQARERPTVDQNGWELWWTSYSFGDEDDVDQSEAQRG